MGREVEDSFDAIKADIISRWSRGKADRRSAFHTPVIGSGGDLRVMVLRAFDPVTGVMRFHTDARSGKVAGLSENSSAAVIGYDAGAKIQIRARGVARIERDTPAADAAWAASALPSRRCYLADPAPGSLSSAPVSGLSEQWELRVPTAPESEAGRDNFSILLFTPHEFEWLHLAALGHRRARLQVRTDGWHGEWLVP